MASCLSKYDRVATKKYRVYFFCDDCATVLRAVNKTIGALCPTCGTIKYYHRERRSSFKEFQEQQRIKRCMQTVKEGDADDAITETTTEQRIHHSTHWVYFVVEEDDYTTTKIGRTSNGNGIVTDRLVGLQTGNPRELRVWKLVEGYDEKAVQDMFKHLWIRGEWYTVDDELHNFINSL